VSEPATDERHNAFSFDSNPDPPMFQTVPAVPVAAASPLTSWPANEPIRAATPGSQESPAVRVHIGRLEIRANLPEPAPPRPRTPPGEAAVKGVSLADYLRGIR